MNDIDAVHVNAPASPIDWILYRLEAEHITVAEITGRATRMRYLDNGSAVHELRTSQDMARFAALSRFNNGGADAIILDAPVYLHTLDIKRQGRPPKPREVQARIAETLQGKPADRCTAGFVNMAS